jgi:hypothetical protein
MLKKTRLSYFIITLFVILLGVLSRNINGIPLFFGDIFYALMVYFGCRMIFIDSNNQIKVLLPLLFCYFIELQQLCDVPWLLKIRQTTLGHYALGQGFLWSDIFFYSLGVFVGFASDLSYKRDTKLEIL